MPSIRSLSLAGAVLGGLLALAGCATVDRDEFVALQGQVYRNQQMIKDLDAKVEGLRRPTANLTSEVAALRQELARTRGQVEETSHRMGSMPKPEDLAAQMERQSSESQEELEKRLKRLEGYLGLKEGQQPPAAPPAPAPGKPAPAPAPAAKSAAMGDKELYELGQRLYKQNSFDAARDRFAEVVDKFAKSSLADSAQFWVGECHYAQKKYEEAILAYNQVIKRWPKSQKAPAALLKQAMAFQALGDKRTAKIVLGKLLKEYPQASQVKTAKDMLAKLD